MQSLTVLYDSSCSLCQWATRWLYSKPKYVQLQFVPANSEEARVRYPHLDHRQTLQSVTVVDDEGNVYQDEKAWIMCLWCLKGYRASAQRLSSPRMMPLTKRYVRMVSQYRPASADNCDGACTV